FFGSAWSKGTGNALSNIIIGNDGPNVLNGLGGNDILTGGKGDDTFVIGKGMGHDTITDFAPGQDVINLDGFGFSSFGQVQALMKASGSATTITFSNGEVLTLQNVAPSKLTAVSFKFTGAVKDPTPPTNPLPPVDPVPENPASSTAAKASGAWAGKAWGTSKTETWTGTDANNWYSSQGGGDTMKGGKGDDTYELYTATDKVVEKAGEGVDTVSTWISAYVLPDNVENLTFFGSAWSKGTGNALSNIIIGNDGPNVLNGLGGNDILTGGKGDDTFVIGKGMGHDTITDFQGAGRTGGDKLQFSGFGAGASLTHQGDVWSIRAADGSVTHLTISGVSQLASNDYAFS
ncbi:hypothetical protein MON41_13940, partial [Roseomonas vastitatis]|nr:hypothetical protein [Pseudoroseomonas vastitatis]